MAKEPKASRETERETALILHDIQASPTLSHRRGSVVQLRGDVFDLASEAGNAIAYEVGKTVDLTLLPDPLPSDTCTPADERRRVLLLSVVGRPSAVEGKRTAEEEADKAHRAALQAAHEKRIKDKGLRVALKGMARK